MAKSSKVSTSKHVSLSEFVMNKKRSECAICKLPDAIRRELRDARKKKYTRAEQMEWLWAAFKIKITVSDFQTHLSGQHEA